MTLLSKKKIVFLVSLAFISITLCSDIDGVAHHGHGDITGARTGAPGRCQTSSCHGGNNALTIVQLQVLDTTTLTPVTEYTPGNTYMVTLTGDATGVPRALPGFGFQVSAVLGTHALGGTYTIPTALASKIHTYPCGTTTVVEHSLTLFQDSTGINKYSTQFYWTAPAAGSDSVSFYSLLNAVNNDRGSGGDYANAGPVVTIYEHVSGLGTALSDNISENFTLFPNPTNGLLHISATQKISSIVVSDVLGKSLWVSGNEATTAHLDISWLPVGQYYIRINGGEIRKVTRL